MIEINNLICLQFKQKIPFYPLKFKVLVTLTLTLKSPGGQKYHRLKDFV